VFCRLPLAFAQRHQFLFRAVLQLLHPFEKHLHHLIAGGAGGLVDQAEQQGEPLGRRIIPQMSGMQGSRFGGEVLDLGGRDALHQAFHLPQGLQPGESGKPLLQVREGGTLGRFFEPIERGEMP